MLADLDRVEVIDRKNISDRQIKEAEIIVLSPGPGQPDDYPETQSLYRSLCGIKPIIGICLGMQIFFSKGSETKNSKGLNLITGEIKKFDNDGVKIGWDKCRNKSKLPSNFIDQTEFFYFNHSFFASTKKRYIFILFIL